MIINNIKFNFNFEFSRSFSSCASLRIPDEDLDLSDKKNKHKATEDFDQDDQRKRHKTTDVETSGITREEKRKELIAYLGEDNLNVVEQILEEEFGLEGIESTYMYEDPGDPYKHEDSGVVDRRNRYDNYPPDQKAELEKAKEQYTNAIDSSEGKEFLIKKRAEISEMIEALGGPEGKEFKSEKEYLGDLFEAYYYAPDKFDADRGLNQYEHKLQDKKKDSDEPDDPDLGGGGVSSNSSDYGEGPSGTSGSGGPSAHRDGLSFKDNCLLFFSTLASFLSDFFTNIF